MASVLKGNKFIFIGVDVGNQTSEQIMPCVCGSLFQNVDDTVGIR